MLYDITRTLSTKTPVFPGDPPVVITPVAQIAKGDPCNVSGISMSLHAGTHIDAPRHYADGAPSVDALDLNALIGPARVVSLSAWDEITREALRIALPGSLAGLAVLVHTRASEATGEQFDPSFTHFTPQAAEWLGEARVRLVGTDAPSVDRADSVELAAHKAFHGAGIYILENLLLRDVPDGDYQLIALPLKIAGADGAPARVVLTA
ncbi:MAG TPA: cyclase family protein [Anaerolineae bacterium]